jgi:hypothetical protein
MEPADHPSAWRMPAILASAAVVIVLIIVVTSAVLAPRSPDPAAFAGDPRMASCLAAAGPVEFAFEMPRARDYQRHFPAMLLSPELDVDEPAFVVVFASGAKLSVGGLGAAAPSDAARTSPNPNERSVCILVGDTPNLYEHVDISGMQVHVEPS